MSNWPASSCNRSTTARSSTAWTGVMSVLYASGMPSDRRSSAAARVGAELALGLGRQVLVPRADRGRDPRLQRGLVDLGERMALGGVDHHMQPR